jgi:hypothetical protein
VNRGEKITPIVLLIVFTSADYLSLIMNAKLTSNPKALHNITWISALGLGMLFILMGLVMVRAEVQIYTEMVFGSLSVIGLLASAAGLSAAVYAIITRLGKHQARNVFYSIYAVLIVVIVASNLSLGASSIMFGRVLILWLIGLSGLLVVTGVVAGMLLQRFD